MSDTDSFIDEVTEEVRRDRLFGMIRRYGWIAALVVLAIVGGAAWKEWRAAQDTAQAQALGDGIVAALEEDDPATRAEALASLDVASPGGQAVRGFLLSAQHQAAGDRDAAIAALDGITRLQDLPEIYGQIAAFKLLVLQGDDLSAQERRTAFAGLARPGVPLRMLAEEQLALIDISEGQIDAAITRLRTILEDAETTSDLQQRASQAIVALGGSLEPRASADQ